MMSFGDTNDMKTMDSATVMKYGIAGLNKCFIRATDCGRRCEYI